MKPKKQRSSLVISFLHSTLHTFILQRSTTGSQKVQAQFSDYWGQMSRTPMKIWNKMVSQKCFLGWNFAWQLCSSSLLLQPLLHPAADAQLNPRLLWLSRMSVHFTRMTLMSVTAPPVSARTRPGLDGPHTLTLWGSSHVKTPNISAAVPDLIRLQLHVSYLSSSSVLL